MQQIARARVTLTVEIDVPDTWGPDCSTGQVFKQASEAAIVALRGGLVLHHLRAGSDTKTPARVVGEPLIRAILVDLNAETPK